MHGADRRQFLLTKRAVYGLVATDLGEDRRDDRVRAHTLEIKTAADLEAGIRIDFPLTVLIQWVPSPAEEYP